MTIVDYIALDEADAARYKEIIINAAERKANAPKKERTPRAPRTPEQEVASLDKKLAKLRAKLEEAKAAAAAAIEATDEE